MEHAVCELRLPMDTVGTRRRGDALAEIVRSLVENLHPAASYERRQHPRSPLPYLMKFVPLDPQGQPVTEEETTVVGKDVSERGLCFFHPRPMPYRRGLVTVDHPNAGRFTVEVELQRCRFHKLGWYESGGRLVRAVEVVFPAAAQAG